MRSFIRTGEDFANDVRHNIQAKSLDFQKDYHEQYFDDKERIIDYILVYNMLKPDVRRDVFLTSLIEINLELEDCPSMVNSEIHFIKVHAPKSVILQYAEKYDIPIKKKQKNFIHAPKPKIKFLRTELTDQNPNSPNYHRAHETFSGEKPTHYLRNERSLITFNILKRIVYGPDRTFDIGIEHLVAKEVFIAAYPPHDGTSHWNDKEDDPLNDRQLLRKYWSSPRNFLKAQPLDVIERYFGDNIALYYAWLSFYNKMLMLGPLIIGLVVTIFNWYFFVANEVPIKEACESNIILCPSCKFCKIRYLKHFCFNYKLTAVTDNAFTIVFAIMMSFWAVIYMTLWKRKQAILALRWNIQNSDLEEQDTRPEFEYFAKEVRLSEFGEPELYIPFFTHFWRKAVAWSICLFMIAIVAFTILCILIAEIAISYAVHSHLMASFISSFISVITIMIFRRVYEPIVIWLVHLEVPQTQTEFYNSYIIKVFCFSFVNNYGALIYTAFFKGKFYTHPNDPRMYNAKLSLIEDRCNPSGCVSEVYIMFQIIMVFLPFMNHIFNYLYANYLVWYHRLGERRKKLLHSNIPRWEKDFELNDFQQTDLLRQYEEMVVQFGFITLFAFAFPAAPFLAFISNVLKIHIDAHNLVVKHRRPQAKRTASIGAWLDIMKFITYLSVVTNACYITFTSDFITKNYYKFMQNGSLSGYVNFTLSMYAINLDNWPYANIPNGTLCYYLGFRNPPDHFMAYEYSYEHYALLAIKFGFIIVVEHIILGSTAILSYAIPSIPSFVRDKQAVETMELRRYLATSPSFAFEDD